MRDRFWKPSSTFKWNSDYFSHNSEEIRFDPRRLSVAQERSNRTGRLTHSHGTWRHGHSAIRALEEIDSRQPRRLEGYTPTGKEGTHRSKERAPRRSLDLPSIRKETLFYNRLDHGHPLCLLRFSRQLPSVMDYEPIQMRASDKVDARSGGLN